MKKIFLPLIGILLSSLLLLPKSEAQTNTSQTPSITNPTCLNQFSDFISSLLSFNSQKDYWNDLLTRNQCQQADIFSLDDQTEALMKRLREEYTKHCSSAEIDQYKQEIREKKMELHFVRYLVPLDEDTNYQNDIDQFKNDFQSIKTNLKKEMTQIYVEKKHWISSTKFDQLFAKWESTYEHRIDNYLSCPDSAWAQLATEWTNFRKTLREITDLFKKTDDNAPSEIDELNTQNKDETVPRTSGEKNAPWATIKKFIQKHIQTRLNGVEPQKGLHEILDEMKQQGKIVSTKEALSLTNSEEERYQKDLSEADLRARYTLLYKKGSAEITAELVAKIKNLSEIISTTATNADYLPGWQKAAKAIWKKQGKGI